MKPIVKTIASQPSWILRGRNVELAVTQTGGHMAPVKFYRNSTRAVQPYYINPWHGEGLKIPDPVLRPLRGDFFCAPFGANEKPYRDEKHFCHGEPAFARWKFERAEKLGRVNSLVLSMKTKVRPGMVTKTISLIDGQNVVYSSHVLEGYTGRMPMGHHPTLALPREEGSLRVATSEFSLGMTNPAPMSDPGGEGSYQSFAVNKRFRDLRRVPLIWKDNPWADCTSFPAREGFTDFMAVLKKPGPDPAWTAAVNVVDGYLWFSLKDPAVLPMTGVWASNRGRHGSPWNGRNLCLGLEDVCAFFADGLAESLRSNVLSKAGIPTAISLSPRRPTEIRYIQGVVKIPRNFKNVKNVRFAKGRASFVSTSGKKVSAAVRYNFLNDGQL